MMSNKKRINKKILQIEKKKLSNFYFRFDKAAKDAEKASVTFLAVVNGVNILISKIQDAKEEIIGTAKLYSEYQSGIDFSDTIIMTGEILGFLNDVRALTGVDDMESKRILAKMPEISRQPMLELIKVGFTLEDAYSTIKDTFKF
jgi:hypothetical protein